MVPVVSFCNKTNPKTSYMPSALLLPHFSFSSALLSSMAATGREIVVFTDTNLDTHLAIDVYLDITAGDFKRKLSRMHLDCFPELGEIEVYGLMVKRRSCFYSLPESMLLRHAFQGYKGSRFLHVEVSSVNGSTSVGLPNHANAESEAKAEAVPPEPRVTQPIPKTKKKKTVKLKCQEHETSKGCRHSSNEEIPGATENQISRKQTDVSPEFMVRTPRKLPCPSSTERSTAAEKKSPRTLVGKRLLTASDNIRAPAHKQSPALSLSRLRAKKHLRQDASSLAKYVAFELSNDS